MRVLWFDAVKAVDLEQRSGGIKQEVATRHSPASKAGARMWCFVTIAANNSPIGMHLEVRFCLQDRRSMAGSLLDTK